MPVSTSYQYIDEPRSSSSLYFPALIQTFRPCGRALEKRTCTNSHSCTSRTSAIVLVCPLRRACSHCCVVPRRPSAAAAAARPSARDCPPVPRSWNIRPDCSECSFHRCWIDYCSRNEPRHGMGRPFPAGCSSRCCRSCRAPVDFSLRRFPAAIYRLPAGSIPAAARPAVRAIRDRLQKLSFCN